jgi:hypothetical protein
MADFVNSFGEIHLRDFIEEMGYRTHRTLQQNFTRLCFMWLDFLAEMGKQGRYDLRNEASCKMARQIVDQFGKGMPLGRYLPHV